jgi:hypothetical protein
MGVETINVQCISAVGTASHGAFDDVLDGVVVLGAAATHGTAAEVLIQPDALAEPLELSDVLEAEVSGVAAHKMDSV